MSKRKAAPAAPTPTAPQPAAPDAGEVAALPNQIPSAFAELVIAAYEEQQAEQMGQLHNRFVAFISESGVALQNVIVVLQLLQQEATALAVQKYMDQ